MYSSRSTYVFLLLYTKVEWTATMDFTQENQVQLENTPDSLGMVLLVAPTLDVQWFVWQSNPNVFSFSLDANTPPPSDPVMGDACPPTNGDDDQHHRRVTWLPVYAPKLTLWPVNRTATTHVVYGCSNGTNVTHIGQLLVTQSLQNSTNTSAVSGSSFSV